MSKTEQGIVCPECGRSFESPQGLGAHRSRTHGYRGTSPKVVRERERRQTVSVGKRARPKPLPDAELRDEVSAALKTAAEGLLFQLEAIDGQLEEAEERVARLRESRHYVVTNLRRISPDLVPGSKLGRPRTSSETSYGVAGASNPAKFERVQRWVEEQGAQHDDGFTAVFIYDELQVEDRDNPEIRNRVGVSAVRRVLEQLHERGVIRVDHKIRGGANVYKVIGGSNGATP